MKTKIQSYTAFIILAMTLFQIVLPAHTMAASNTEKLVYPLKEISKLDCRFEDFNTLSSNCKRKLPILKSKDYKKYATLNGWYNDYTRIYTVLWGSSYKYGWDVGSGWHQGTDIATAKGTPVYVMASGTVIESTVDANWGKHISVEHIIRGKKVISNYAHMSKLLVKKWEKVRAWDKIWEVWSTWNSTGNHLHFQIDLPNVFHPYYYDWNACPYSYYEITEKGVCFDELARNTFDPFAFLESNGAILDTITKTSKKITPPINPISKIVSITISPENGTSQEIKEVQKIYRDLGYYKGSISGKYSDLKESLIDYQVKSWVIASRNSDGAGWFGPKTRKQTKKDYEIFLTANNSSIQKKNTQSLQKVEKVSRAQLLTREEIEAREVQDFLKKYNISFANTITHININDTKTTTLKVKNTRGKAFRWNTPANVSFSFDESKISVFPKKFYNFRNGTRDISITWKSAGHTSLSVKIWDVIIKSFSITVWKAGKALTVKSAKIYTKTQAVLGSENTAIVVMKDDYGNKLVRASYDWKYKIKSSWKAKYCIKKWKVRDIKSLYTRKCQNEEYTDSLEFTYQDTVGWLLLFDYKLLDTSSVTFTVEKIGRKKHLTQATIRTQVPKGLTKNYEYFDEVVSTLASGMTTGINKWYFLEKRSLTWYDAKVWLENTLRISNDKDADTKIQKIRKEAWDKSRTLTRWEFLDLLDDYLWNKNQVSRWRKYRDFSQEWADKVSSLLWENYRWKDSFWENYFQPTKKITRWEAAFMLTQALKESWQHYLVKR